MSRRRAAERGARKLCPVIALGLAVGTICGCSPDEPDAAVFGDPLVVRVVVDTNGNMVADEADVPLAGVSVLIDGEREEVTDAEGIARFCEIDATSHRVSLSPDELMRLSECGLTVQNGEIEVSSADGFVELLLGAVGFLHVDVEAEGDAI